MYFGSLILCVILILFKVWDMALLINPSQRLLLVDLLFYSIFCSLAVVPLAESDYNFVRLLVDMLQ